MYANVVVGNSEKSLVDNGVNEKSEWIRKIQPNIPQYDEYGKWWWIVHDNFRSNLYFQSDLSEKYTAKFHISKKIT